MRPVRFPWISAAVGIAAFVAAILVLGLPGRIRQGESGQAAIQMLDAMRRPFLAIKEAETSLIRTGDVRSAGRELDEAADSASVLLARYRRLAQYNPELTQRVAELSETYAVWLAFERRLFEVYSGSPRAGSLPKDRGGGALFVDERAEAAEAAGGFLATMNRLGDGEEPIHRDIDGGRSAGHILLSLSAFLLLYTFGLIVLFQQWRSRRLWRSRGDLERRVADADRLFRTIVETEPDCVKLLASDGTVLEMNAAGLAMVEADSRERVIGRPVYDLIAPEHRQDYREHLQRVCQGGDETLEFEVVGLRGSRRWMRSRAVCLTAGAWTEGVYLAVTRDVTPERAAEAALRESEENFRALADNANDSIVIAVEPERHVYANRPAAEMIGYTVEELLAKTPRDILHPDEYPKLAERLRKRLAGENVPTRYETVIRHKDGRLVPVEVTAARTTWRGRPASIGVTRDMTERKQAEEERAALYQQNRAMVRRLLEMQEEERKTLAQEIHDDL
ncbi:MAG: PAS domain S-box protein, partial [Nitrospirae bacterium]|nr:PAS domain S-box protein [Nitrospirota bacterium]